MAGLFFELGELAETGVSWFGEQLGIGSGAMGVGAEAAAEGGAGAFATATEGAVDYTIGGTFPGEEGLEEFIEEETDKALDARALRLGAAGEHGAFMQTYRAALAEAGITEEKIAELAEEVSGQPGGGGGGGGGGAMQRFGSAVSRNTNSLQSRAGGAFRGAVRGVGRGAVNTISGDPEAAQNLENIWNQASGLVARSEAAAEGGAGAANMAGRAADIMEGAQNFITAGEASVGEGGAISNAIRTAGKIAGVGGGALATGLSVDAIVTAIHDAKTKDKAEELWDALPTDAKQDTYNYLSEQKGSVFVNTVQQKLAAVAQSKKKQTTDKIKEEVTRWNRSKDKLTASGQKKRKEIDDMINEHMGRVTRSKSAANRVPITNKVGYTSDHNRQAAVNKSKDVLPVQPTQTTRKKPRTRSNTHAQSDQPAAQPAPPPAAQPAPLPAAPPAAPPAAQPAAQPAQHHQSMLGSMVSGPRNYIGQQPGTFPIKSIYM